MISRVSLVEVRGSGYAVQIRKTPPDRTPCPSDPWFFISGTRKEYDGSNPEDVRTYCCVTNREIAEIRYRDIICHARRNGPLLLKELHTSIIREDA